MDTPSLSELLVCLSGKVRVLIRVYKLGLVQDLQTPHHSALYGMRAQVDVDVLQSIFSRKVFDSNSISVNGLLWG